MGRLKRFIKKHTRKSNGYYENPFVSLSKDNNKIIFTLDNDNSDDEYIFGISHRVSNKNIEKKVKSNKVSFTIDEIRNLSNTGYFDCYIKLNDSSEEKKRIKFKDENNSFYLIFNRTKLFRAISTKYNNLSFRINPNDLTYEIEDYRIDGKNFTLNGKFKFSYESIDLNVNDDVEGNYFEIKHRKTGKRLDAPIINGQVTFSLDEIISMENEGIFDAYFKIHDNFNYFKKRISYTSEIQAFKVLSKENGRIFSAYATERNNLSFEAINADFDHNITEIIPKENSLIVKGNLEVINKDIEKVDKIFILGKNRLDSQSNVFELNIKETEIGKYDFEGIITPYIESDEKILDLRMDFLIRVCAGDIYFQELINLSNYKSFENDENRFLTNIETNENIYSYYATKNKQSLALWITTETAWEKSYIIAQGRTIYNKYFKEPVDKKMVFFESFFGKAYSGNPKYIYETMLEMGLDKEYTFVWAYSGEDKSIIPGNPIIVERFEPGDYYKYLALSKYWVNNIIFPIHKKRKENVYLQTWHGTPLKRLGFDITIPGPEVEGRRNFYHESRNWDYLISSNAYSSEIFERAFKFNKTFLEMGYPINDIFFRDNDQFIRDLKSQLNIPSDKKIILYAPTWKDDEQNESWEHYFNLEIDLERLYNKFSDEYVILLKMHHLVSENLVIDEKMKDFAIDLSGYDDIQELYILSDILITDYSSVFFDYAHSRRPILFFVPDLAHYINNVRGLYLDMKDELPGPLIMNNDDLIEVISNIDQVSAEYAERYDEFYERFCSLCTGKSGENIVKKVFKID